MDCSWPMYDFLDGGVSTMRVEGGQLIIMDNIP